MKIKHLIITLLFSILMILLFSNSSNAADITYRTEPYDSINTAIYVKGLESLSEGYQYFIQVSQNNALSQDELLTEAKNGRLTSLSFDSTKNEYYIQTSSLFGIFEKAGDYYAYLVKGDPSKTGLAGTENSFSVVDGPSKLDRPELLPNGKRITVYLNADSTQYFVNQNAYYTKVHGTDRKIKFHLGEIKDTSLLQKLVAKEASAYDLLYTYAQDASKYLYSGEFDTTATGITDYNILKDYNGLEVGKCYFMFYELDTENGTYVELNDVNAYYLGAAGFEDITEYKAEADPSEGENGGNNGGNGGGIIPKTNGKDPTVATVKIPKAGIAIAGVSAFIVISSFAVVLYFKNKKYKGIK